MRPYIGHSIQQLEALVRGQGSDLNTLNDLARELSFRKTARARALASSIQKRLADVPVQVPVRPASTAPMRTRSVTSAPQPARPVDNQSMEAPRSGPPTPDSQSPTISLLDLETHREIDYTNRPIDLLDAWTALEVLSPQTYRREADLAGGAAFNIVSLESSLPWDTGPAPSKLNSKVYFHVVLGTLTAGSAFDALINRFKDSRAERPGVAGNIILASILVDKSGIPAGDMPLSISAFGWGFPKALAGSLKDLAEWTRHEGGLVEGLRKQLPKDQRTGGLGPLTSASLHQAFEWLVATLGLPREHVSGPQFAVRVYLHFRSSIVPDPLLLNSFFLRDLAKVRDLAHRGSLPAALAAYLGERPPASKHDLLHNSAALEAAVAPHKAPLGRWPTPAGHTPSLLQQAAVNLAARMHERTGLLGVNGPPGTGKSTLLRDIVADNVVRRAHAMCGFTEPTKAFKVGFTERVRGETQELYTLHPSLRGFEMVVVSSNNKAVENVSAELPALGALPNNSELRYFAPLATQIGERDAWGLIAAVLGNATNRSHFRKTFWTEGTNSFQRYLDRAAGLTAPDDTPALADECDAPSGPSDALDRWKLVRLRFNQLEGQIKARLVELETLRLALLQLPELREQETAAQQRHAQAIIEHDSEQSRLSAATREAENSRKLVIQQQDRIASHASTSPGWLKRLFRTATARSWKAAQGEFMNQLRIQQQLADQLALSRITAAQRAQDAFRAVEAWEGDVRRTAEARQTAEKHRATVFVGKGAMPVDKGFHDLPHAQKQLTLPWLDEDLQGLRSKLFHCAMEVHKAFIDAAALPLRRNLKALMDANFSNIHAKRAHLTTDLWTSLFLVVPVVSTTFASVERMLGRVSNEALGWILVDEAGQATPQSAVGALLRAQRAIVVGDPQQIEPVVPLPDILTAAVMREYGADPDRFSAPSASVQTLADDASDHCAVFQTAAGSRSVGAPLLVHRRCSSPMFDVSNQIAYGGQMVQAKASQPSAIKDALGPSRWIDVRGSATEKFSPEEAEQVLRLLQTLKDRGVAPDVYLVSPFVAVQDGLRQFVNASGLLNGWVDDPRAWIKERIGTVHTVQGREAEAVVVVLGAPLLVQSGARQWAGRLPNLLNVAATRAKEAIYIVGNREQWEGAGHFGVLSKHLA